MPDLRIFACPEILRLKLVCWQLKVACLFAKIKISAKYVSFNTTNSYDIMNQTQKRGNLQEVYLPQSFHQTVDVCVSRVLPWLVKNNNDQYDNRKTFFSK